MPSTVPPRDWTEIHWPDIARSDAARWIAVLPLAAVEQHGPHLPLGVDTYIAEACWHCHSQFIRPVSNEDVRRLYLGEEFRM